MDVPEGLPVPSISAPPASIPKWNAFHGNWLVPVFDFATEYLKDRGALLVMYPASSPHKAQLLACCEEYGFRIAQSWLGMNRLHLTSPSNSTVTVFVLYSSCIHFLISRSFFCELTSYCSCRPCGSPLHSW